MSKTLKERNIEWEYEASDFTVLMFTPENTDADLKAVENALTNPPAFKENELKALKPKKVCSAREALFFESEKVDIEKAVGRVLADVSVSCPPAVPVLISGEEVSKEAVEIFRFYNIKEVNVIK